MKTRIKATDLKPGDYVTAYDATVTSVAFTCTPCGSLGVRAELSDGRIYNSSEHFETTIIRHDASEA
jgi:hypothetical protein